MNLPSSIFDRRQAEESLLSRTFPRPRPSGARSLLQARGKETALPVLTFAAAGVGGDVPATGRLIINNDDANNDQRWLTWGLQSRRYDPAATAALFYEAEALTPQGGSTTGAESGASGGNGVLTGNLTYLYQSVLSTQLSAGAGAHLTHVGRYRVYARIHANTTNGIAVSLRLQWADGDFRNPTLNDPFEGVRHRWTNWTTRNRC